MPTKLICFDLDHTLIREIHSVMLPCILNGRGKEHMEIQKKEEAGLLDYITADHQRARLFRGLEEINLYENFLSLAKPLKHIPETIEILHAHNIKTILVTVGSVQVAKAAVKAWNFDDYYGSIYEVIDGRFTGTILQYIRAENKIDCLVDFCMANHIAPSECIAVGDGAIDIPMFEYCGKSVAVNGSKKARERAGFSIDTDDLSDILPFLLPPHR